ncbi:DUF4269 domain-containing protein [Paenibacillus sp. J31TS4]|uniref:DUF4269 domain-containing protein n=1 Tax=Paenibacillus sp. J31TS4 TaxID=2807195 RepID=UPI001BCC26A4|nr:DUF4269 domain-containing protein [Paenibacillus sp. J31TS4]
METDFTTIDYLKEGGARQREAYDELTRLGLMEALASHKPLLAGTIPLGIDLLGSDLDILCEVYDFDRFEKEVREFAGGQPAFRCSRRTVNGMPRFVASFQSGVFPVEIFAQPLPTTSQNGYRHLVVEHRLLLRMGDAGRRTVRRLKAAGRKTEPAFAELLGLEGDPYARLLELERCTDAELDELVEGARSKWS